MYRIIFQSFAPKIPKPSWSHIMIYIRLGLSAILVRKVWWLECHAKKHQITWNPWLSLIVIVMVSTINIYIFLVPLYFNDTPHIQLFVSGVLTAWTWMKGFRPCFDYFKACDCLKNFYTLLLLVDFVNSFIPSGLWPTSGLPTPVSKGLTKKLQMLAIAGMTQWYMHGSTTIIHGPKIHFMTHLALLLRIVKHVPLSFPFLLFQLKPTWISYSRPNKHFSSICICMS